VDLDQSNPLRLFGWLVVMVLHLDGTDRPSEGKCPSANDKTIEIRHFRTSTAGKSFLLWKA
jgi:hypothetical protein